jgi:uncharacterized protein YggE
MKNFAKFLLLAVVSMAANVGAQENALPASRHILVYGEAHARAIPDRFKIEIEFNVLDQSADRARSKVEGYMKDTISKLQATGVSDNDVVATTLNIQPDTDYDDDLHKQVYHGIRVTRTIKSIFNDQNALRGFLAQLKTSEEVQVSGVETELSSESELMAALRQKAIESTREKAEVIAKAYGVRLVGLYSVSDTAPKFNYGIQEGSWPANYRWSRHEDGSSTLDRIEVTGSRIKRADVESFETGYVNYDDKIYAVFLISE